MRTHFLSRLSVLCCLSLATIAVGQGPAGNAPPAAPEQDTEEVNSAAKPANATTVEASADAAKQTWQDAEVESIRKEVESYAAAFNAKDVAGLLSKWSPQGVYVSRTSGEEFVGSEALKKEFSRILGAEEPPKLALQTETIEFISPNVAVERGVAVVTVGENIDETSYQVVYIKSGDRWLIDRVSEQDVFVRSSHYDALRELEFLVGDWVSEGDSVSVEIECRFTTNQNFLSRTYRVIRDGEIESNGLQIIGWDAKKEQIRSWLFDSEGGFVHGEWSQHDDVWVCQAVATLGDGAVGSYTGVFRPIDADNVGWRKTNRVLDGELLPGTDELLFRRR